MEDFGAQVDIPIDVCIREARKADVVVLIIGPRYGSLLPSGISYTHAEFREARGAGIPVLAFRVPDGEVSEEEKERISDFLTEVGSTTTFDSLLSADSFDRLSPKILAALTTAKDKGELANRFSLFQPYRRYFARELDGDAVFNHQGPFVGRDSEIQQLSAFINGAVPLLLLKAPGGCGKSRLLLETARAVAENPDSPKVLFVDSGAHWSSDDINRLPITPTVLVFDDAHRRPDLDRLIADCHQHNEYIRCIVSCRPSAVGVVRPLIASMITGSGLPEIELASLTKDCADSLASACLGNELSHLADRLVRLADRNPLVIRVGARCIVEKLVVPEILERTPEVFGNIVLDRLLNDPGLTQEDETLRRKILQVLAAVGPISSEDVEFVVKLKSVLSSAEHEIRRILAILERSGYLLRRGRLIRVTPDVLSDHLLYQAAVDEIGRATGFVEVMVRNFAPSMLENILANAAELDWRGTATASHDPVLTSIWRDILGFLPEATNSQRTRLLQQIKRAAVFAPEDVLRIAEWLADFPIAPEDKERVRWGLEDNCDTVKEALTDLFSFIASHSDFTYRCLSRLWNFAVIDDRATNPNPSHPRRRIHDLVKYESQRNWKSAESVQAKTIEFLIERLLDPARSEKVEWAFPILASALDRFAETTEFSRRQVSFGQFSLANSFNEIRNRRHAVVLAFEKIAYGVNVAEAAAAVCQIAVLLHAPRPLYGARFDIADLEVWRPEAENAIALIEKIAKSAKSEIVRFIARRQFRDFSRQSWPWIGTKVEVALRSCPPVANEELFDLLYGVPWQEKLDNFSAEEQRIYKQCQVVAEALWSHNRTAEGTVAALMGTIADLNMVTDRIDTHLGQLVISITKFKCDAAHVVVEQLIASGTQGWQLLRPALFALHGCQPQSAHAIVFDKLVDSEHEFLRAQAVDALRFMADASHESSSILKVARSLSQDSSTKVKEAVAQMLCSFREKDPVQALEILCSIDWGNDLSMAEDVLQVLDSKYGLDPALLSNADVDAILARIEKLPSLEGRNYNVLEFIAFASAVRPRQTVEMLLRRIMVSDQTQTSDLKSRHTPIPYSAHGMSLPGLQNSTDYLNFLRSIRDAAIDADNLVRFWLPELFRVAATDLTTALVALREFVRSGECAKIVAAARLMRGFDHGIVFSSNDFVAELLQAAANSSDECLKRAGSELYGLATTGMYSSLPGEPAPRHLNMKAEAAKLAEQYSNVAAVFEFYMDLVRHAEHSIKREMDMWDEEGDEV